MRKFKTKKDNRETYVYYSAEGTKITIVPGENGVSEADIEMLHSFDDEELDAQRRENYYIPVHYDAYVDEDGELCEDRNAYLEDTNSDPLSRMISELDEYEHNLKLKKIKKAVIELEPRQQWLLQQIYVEKRSRVDIAAEENVTEAAIRNRLQKIYKKIIKYFEK